MIGSFEAEKLPQKRQTSMLFGRPRAATRGRNRISRGKPRKGQTLENVDFLLHGFYTIFCHAGLFGEVKKRGDSMRATRTGIVPQRTQKLTEHFKNPVKNGNKTEHASKTLPGTTFR